MKKIIVVLCLGWLCLCAYAVVASPEPFEYTKSDGTKVMARMHGDEFHSYITTLDGVLLEGNIDAETIEQAEMVRRKVQAQQAAGHSAFPTKGSPRSLVILVGFADLPFGETHQDFQDLLTKSGYNHNGAIGSCRDYYIASSDSIFSPQFDCYGPYTLSQNMAYYGGNNGNNNNIHAAQMVSEACTMAHEAGVNFKDYDTNNDGMLDNVFIFYAGHNEAEGGGENTIWPHASNISYLNVRLDGVLVASYACTSEYRGPNGKVRCGIGTFCHEFGHVIGQPDFYDTTYKYYSVGNWDVMCSGSYNNGGNAPPTFSAYERMYEGWLTPTQLELPGQYALSAVPFKAQAYLIAAEEHNLSGSNPNPREFFLLECRNANNGWDAYLPGHGMLVWHIDYSASAWSSNTPNNGPTIMRMHLEEANGIGWKKRSNGDEGRSSDPYPGTQKVTNFSPTLHDGTQLAQPIFNIQETGNIITFVYISSGGSMLKASKERIEMTTMVNEKKQIVDWEPQSFELYGKGLAPDKAVLIKTNESHFFVSAKDECPGIDDAWSLSTEIYPEADSTLQRRIWVNYHPKKMTCTPTETTISISSPAVSLSIPLVGHAPRPTLVTTPTDLSATNVTPYSFTANWNNIADAEQYYLTLYQTEEGETEFVQSFENFDDYDKIREEGWKSNTNLTTTSAKASGVRALYMKNYGDQITSETYPSAITRLSWWYNAFKADIDTVGVLELEGHNGEEWSVITQVIVTKKSKQLTASFDFELKDNYRTFRLTWLDNGGSGIALDVFRAVTSEKITYLYKGKELTLPSFEDGQPNHTFGSLNPNSKYYWQVQCTDLNKGCEEHLTDLSKPMAVSTFDGNPVDSKQLSIAYDSINFNPAEHAIYLLEPHAGDYLYFYTSSGNMVYSIPVYADIYVYSLPIHLFTSGEIYLVQHAVKGTLGRKNKWLKFIFH